MSVLEVLAFQIGPSIAKAILKLWLKGPVGNEVASSVLDVIKTRTQDAMSQKKAARQFEAIGEKVAESLLPLFDSEDKRSDETDGQRKRIDEISGQRKQIEESERVSFSKEAVALEVANSLRLADITPELLADQNLQPTKLAAYIRNVHPNATETFSAKEAALYERIITEASQSIIDVASQLPNFNERTLAEILIRETQLLDITAQVLKVVEGIRAESQRSNQGTSAKQFEELYRRAVARQLDVLQLFGADLSTSSKRHNLSVAYITLSVKHDEKDVAYVPNRIGRHVNVDDALGSSMRLLLRGQAGSGKTTLLQWVAVRSATNTFADNLSHWNGFVPFFIRLRECADGSFPRPELFPGLVAPTISAMMPDHWVHQKLLAGNAIILVDGVDEVPDYQREIVRTNLKQLVEMFPKARYIVTARPHAATEGWMADQGFDDAELQPMELPNIYNFIDHWHNAVQEQVEAETEKNEIVVLAEDLKAVLRASRSLRNLATSPLLCAMLCALHRDRHSQLPSDRIELYEACCHMLIERRDIERKVRLTEYPVLQYRQKKAILEDLAYWMLKNNWALVSSNRAKEHLTTTIEHMPGIPTTTSSDGVLKLLVERSGVVREPVQGQLDFTHRTFQEFLAARAILDTGDLGLLLQNAARDQWREVIVLAAGLGKAKEREEIISELIAMGDAQPELRHQLHLLSVACLETSVQLEPSIKAVVQQRLSALVPPRSSDEVRSLASAGELAVPYLRRMPEWTATSCTLSVQALARIGGTTALDTLAEYSDDSREEVYEQLVLAWDNFDRSEYAEKVLSRAVEIWRVLKIDGSVSLDGFQHLKGLISLEISSGDGINELSPLSDLVMLNELRLSDFPHISNIRPLAHLTNLTCLVLRDFPQLEDIKSLETLTNLVLLDMTNNRQVSDIYALSGLVKMQELVLAECENISNISALSRLCQLTELNLNTCRQVNDLSALTGLVNLKTLKLACTAVADLQPMAGLTKLETLILYYCERVHDLGPLANLISLTTLNIEYCKNIENTAPIAQLPNLRNIAKTDRFSGSV